MTTLRDILTEHLLYAEAEVTQVERLLGQAIERRDSLVERREAAYQDRDATRAALAALDDPAKDADGVAATWPEPPETGIRVGYPSVTQNSDGTWPERPDIDTPIHWYPLNSDDMPPIGSPYARFEDTTGQRDPAGWPRPADCASGDHERLVAVALQEIARRRTIREDA